MKDKTHLSWTLRNNIHLQKLFNVSPQEEQEFQDSYNKQKKKERTKDLAARLKEINEQEQRWKLLKKDTPLSQHWFINHHLIEIYKKQEKLQKSLKFLRSKPTTKHKDIPMEEIRQVPIEELVPYGKEKHRKSPTEFTILCPAHADTHPSCSINTEKNVWHCFSCQAGGTNIGYVMAEYNLNSSEATKRIINLIN